METKAEQKARRKETVILRLMNNEKLPEVLKDYPDMKLSPATWSRLKKRYGRGGFEALIDHRKGLPYKLNPEIREFVIATKGSDPNLSSKELVGQVKEKYGVILSKSIINQVLRKAGISGHVGRRPGRVVAEEIKVLRKVPPKAVEVPPEEIKVPPREAEPIPMEYAGCFFLKGADCDMLGTHTITRVVKEEVAKAGKALSEDQVIREGALRAMNELLLYLPIFAVKRVEDLDPSEERPLALLIESDKLFSSNEISRYLKQVASLRVSAQLDEELARCYSEALAIKVELEDKTSFYIDGHLKTLWQDKKIPDSFSISYNKIKSYINRFFLNSSKDDPLVLSICPGYIDLRPELFNLLEGFGGRKAIVELSIIGSDRAEVDVFKGIRLTKRYFIAYLSPWQYKGLEDFQIKKGFIDWETDLYSGKPKIADAEIDLIDAASDVKWTVRAVLIKEGEKLRALISNITPQEEPDMRKIVTAYFLRWPNKRERSFYDLMWQGLKERSLSNEELNPSGAGLKEFFSLLLDNLNRYVQKHYFPKKYNGLSIEEMVKTSYKQMGYVKQQKDSITVTLDPYDEPRFQEAVGYACRRFNEGDVRSPGGKRISIYLKAPNHKIE